VYEALEVDFAHPFFMRGSGIMGQLQEILITIQKNFMTRTAWIWVVLAVIVIGGGAYFLMSTPTANTTDITLAGDQSGNPDDGQPAPGADTVPSGTGTGTGTGTGSVSGSVDVGVSTAPMSVTVTYNGTSYSPKDVTIKRGGTVTWKNASTGNMWVASASHPSHTVYDGTSRSEHCTTAGSTPFDQCKGGGDYSFTFTKAGKWGYHDHINASAFGSVTVVE
jgi:plastocyanin